MHLRLGLRNLHELRTSDRRVRVYNTGIIRQLKRLYGGCCQLCGENAFREFNADISEAHHIAYFSDSQNNDSSNIIILCPNHHRLIHKLNPKFDYNRGCFVFSENSELRIELDFHLMKWHRNKNGIRWTIFNIENWFFDWAYKASWGFCQLSHALLYPWFRGYNGV